MLTFDEVSLLFFETRCSVLGKEFCFTLGKHSENQWYLQVGMEIAGKIWKGGKFYISPHSTRDEVVKKFLLACITFMEHEVREGFKWRGAKIFGPHITLEALLEASRHTEGRK